MYQLTIKLNQEQKWLRSHLVSVAILLLSGCSFFPEKMSNRESSLSLCDDSTYISVHCGRTPSLAFDNNDRLWAVFAQGKALYLSYSVDKGKLFSKPVKVTSVPEEIYSNGENRPKLIVSPNNNKIYISWSQKTAGRFNGDIRFSRSIDGGKTFSTPLTVNDDGLLTGHRFDSMLLSDSGDIFISWIDKRDQLKAKSKNKPRQQGAIYYAVSLDNGKSFQSNKKVADSSCVCCRIAMSKSENDQINLFWRHVFGDNIRDHALATVDKKSVVQPLQRASYDDWKIEACPHHGPSLARSQDGKYHMVWFTAADKRKGIFYANTQIKGNLLDRTQLNSDLINVSNNPSASHADILENNDELYIVWKSFDGTNTNVHNKISKDQGSSWGEDILVATTNGASDHPLLIKQQKNSWLSWFSQKEGLRLVQVNVIAQDSNEN